MSTFSYVAFDARGRETSGCLDVADQAEALRRIREMGFYPSKVIPRDSKRVLKPKPQPRRPGVVAFRVGVWRASEIK